MRIPNLLLGNVALKIMKKSIDLASILPLEFSNLFGYCTIWLGFVSAMSLEHPTMKIP